MGLSEVMASAGKHQLVVYMGELIPTIRTALCDKYVCHTACFWVVISLYLSMLWVRALYVSMCLL
jgi:hypothetical protein